MFMCVLITVVLSRVRESSSSSSSSSGSSVFVSAARRQQRRVVSTASYHQRRATSFQPWGYQQGPVTSCCRGRAICVHVFLQRCAAVHTLHVEWARVAMCGERTQVICVLCVSHCSGTSGSFRSGCGLMPQEKNKCVCVCVCMRVYVCACACVCVCVLSLIHI